jgi:hypothetical protein
MKLLESVWKRIIWLYGLHTILWNLFFVISYYLLPEGFMRSSPQVAVGGVVAEAGSFWGQLGLTLLFNLGGLALLCVVLNCNQVRGVPAGYLVPVALGVVSGLILGSNSFAASNLSIINARDGLAMGITIGGLEMLGYIFVIAATANLGIYQYRSWWRWSGEYKAVKTMQFRDVRLSRAEVLCLTCGVLLILAGAYNETAASFRRPAGF